MHSRSGIQWMNNLQKGLTKYWYSFPGSKQLGIV